MDNTDTLEIPKPRGLTTWLMVIAASTVVWVVAYAHLAEFADLLLALTGLSRDSRLGEAVHFFLYDTPKVLLLLTGVVFLMGVIQTFFAPERTRALLAGRRLGMGNVLAAHLGIVTPFCSCSAVPLFIGFLSAGVPMYTNAAGVIPVVEALIGKGAALGTVLAFMMSVIALSAPEMIILRKVLKPRLIAVFAGVVAAGILLVGYLFNIVLS
jgi:uncharacterized membrane protein YraQ (UPF0718 family)